MFVESEHLVNPALLDMVKGLPLGGFAKSAFIPGGDPSMGGGAGGGAPPGGDPSGGGGDPSGGGGAPPGGDPSGGGGGGAPPMDPRVDQLMVQLQQIQQQMQAGGGAGGGSGGGLKPKIDVNVELMQIKNMMAKICDHLGIQMPAQDMVATPDKLNAMAAGQPTASPPGTGAAGAGAAGGAVGGMGGMDPMAGAGVPGGGPEKAGSYRSNGTPFDTSGLGRMVSKASAIQTLRLRRQAG